MSSDKVPIGDKFRGWNKNSPIYDHGFVIAKPNSESSSPSTKDEQPDPMKGASDITEAWLQEQARKYGAAPSESTEKEPKGQ